MPAHKHDLQKGATSDPHDEMAPQKVESWTAAGLREGTAVRRPREQVLKANNIQDHPRTYPKDATAESRISAPLEEDPALDHSTKRLHQRREQDERKCILAMNKCASRVFLER